MTDPVVVTGFGMRTPLGEHAVQTCASVRAEMTRFVEWSQFAAGDAGVAASFVHPELPDGPWYEKAFPLLEPAVHEALHRARLFDLAAQRRALEAGRVRAFLAVPYPDRVGAETEAYEELREDVQEGLLPDDRIPVQLLAMENTGGFAAVAHAVEAIQAGEADLCLVAGVDSFLDSELLQWAVDERRVLTARAKSGFVPGEAGAVVVLESAAAAAARGAKPLLRILAVGLDQDAPFTREGAVQGNGLGRAVRHVLDATGGPGAVDLVVSDANGERWRHLEWALVETRCLGGLPRGCRRWQPAESLGHVGAAFGPLAVGLAARGYERGYAGSRALLGASAPGGERGALVVENPETQ